MGILVKKLRVAGDKGERRLWVLFDTGASDSFIRQNLVDEVATRVKLASPKTYTLADGMGKLRAREAVVLDVSISGVTITDNFVVAPKLSDEAIIGANTLQKWRIKLDLENERILIDKRVARRLLA